MNDGLSSEIDTKRCQLLERLAGCGSVAVAFSGGVDSAVVAKAAAIACGDTAVAVTAVSPSLASGELESAIEQAKQIGIRHVVVQTTENEDPDYRRNAPNRCYFCKSELYARLDERLDELGVDCIANGANADDAGDHRPGMQAATEHRVLSPLLDAGLTKAEVRTLAAAWGLQSWDKPASPCLASRIAYGVEVTEERLRRVDDAERFLRARFGLRELRVRLETSEVARIEVPVESIPLLVDADSRSILVAELRRLGFRYITIDLEGFRSGSLNEVLPLVELSAVSEKPSKSVQPVGRYS